MPIRDKIKSVLHRDDHGKSGSKRHSREAAYSAPLSSQNVVPPTAAPVYSNGASFAEPFDGISAEQNIKPIQTIEHHEGLSGIEATQSISRQSPVVTETIVETVDVTSPIAREVVTSTAESDTLSVEPVSLERVEKPLVVHEHIHPVEKQEVQPVIFREREQLEVKQITQQLHETEIKPTVIQSRELPAQVRPAIVENSAPIPEQIILPSVEVEETQKSLSINEPIINETVKRTVIEEIQPVLERDVIQPTLIHQTLPIYEKVVDATVVYKSELPVRELGPVGHLDSSYGMFLRGPVMVEEQAFLPGKNIQ
ncbi:hypothetical protein PROFUN_13225 [Planoprotostelium fungivorum]|uniref:Uncharacterized protein n=1 Tax=Planoprotostelium fungivorum TaxID=1890364 RepID=A0A2P6N4R2_9EUKA|nr:hypothetical protein PROFUN_14203 [Planoprotostelium fungivorum]PRP78931.1 hypothetical protein PROFUN_13225 [Planoprotostelium fungivorum]